MNNVFKKISQKNKCQHYIVNESADNKSEPEIHLSLKSPPSLLKSIVKFQSQ